MKYLLIIAHDEEFRPTNHLVSEIHAWISDCVSRGVRVHGNPLHPAGTATTVRIRGGKRQVSSGTFSHSKEQICAYELVECDNKEAAVELALRHPMAEAASIEVRPIWSDLTKHANSR